MIKQKQIRQFLLVSMVLAYISFGIIVVSNASFNEISSSPLHMFLLLLGFLSPFISSLLVYLLNKDELGGLPAFIDNFRVKLSSKGLLLVGLLLIAHYAFGIIFNNVESYGSVVDFFKYLPIMVILLGSQEIGWRKIQAYYEEKKGFIRSVIITGLFWAIWFLPLLFIRGFFVHPAFYTQFAGYLIGISFLLTSIYKVTNQISYSIILSSLIFALAPVILFKANYILLALALLEAFVSVILKNKKIYP
ncbi:MAG TPA: hypothetical protein VFC79_09435 [Tissierellaceae bacterium]|nr:hypothetical protein [Tissierellaceae bacterium]